MTPGNRRPARPWWIYPGAASFLGYFALVMFSTYYRPTGMGIRIGGVRPEGLTIGSLIPGLDAERAGVQPGDRLIAIDGRPLHNIWEYSAVSASASVGEAHTWRFERSGRRFEVTAAPQRRQFFPLLRFLPVNLALLVSMVLALVVIFNRPDDRASRLGALLLAGIACASPPTPGVALPWPVGLAGTWRHLPAAIGALLWPACLATFAAGPIAFSFFAVFPRPVIRRRWIRAVVLAPAMVMTAVMARYLFLVVYQPERALDLPVWLAVVGFSSLPAAYYAGGLGLLVWNYRRSTAVNDRRRIRVLLAGMTSGGIGVSLFNAPVFITNNDRWSGVLLLLAGPAFLLAGLLVAALPGAFAYAIVAARLFDIRIIIRQGLQYALARRSILLLVPALSAGLVVDLLVNGNRPLLDIIASRGGAYAALAGFAIVAYRQRDRWMTSLDRRFFREQYDAHQVLGQVIEDVRTAPTLDAVAPVVVSRLTATWHPTFAALLACEPHQLHFRVLAIHPETISLPPLTRQSTLVGVVRVLGKPIDASSSPDLFRDSDTSLPAAEAGRIDLIAPIAVASPGRGEALLVLGRKRSEEPYGRDDRALVASVAASLAFLVERLAAATDDGFAECPRCGACEPIHTSRCPADGTALMRVSIPRLLGGRYTIRRRLGRGGMGAVYEARDGILERRVAVKVIRDDMAGRPDTAERFRREALVVAGFAHPHVCAVYDFGVTDNARGYLVMERLDGASLRDTLDVDGTLTPTRTLEILRGVSQAVDAAHRRGLVHRDLKPDNIFLTSDGIAKVLDFGIATFIQPGPDSEPLTATGAIVGTLGYMAPEQIHGGLPQPSWDVWALGVVAYQMLTGNRPFADLSPGDAGGGRDAMMSGATEKLTTPLNAMFATAFALDPVERPSGALGFIARLEAALAA